MLPSIFAPALISTPSGLSKESRAANDLFWFAQMALPKGTHRIPDSYHEHLTHSMFEAAMQHMSAVRQLCSWRAQARLEFDVVSNQ